QQTSRRHGIDFRTQSVPASDERRHRVAQRSPGCLSQQTNHRGVIRLLYMDIGTEAKVRTPRCGVTAPCRRGTDASPCDEFVTLARSVPPLNAAGTAQRAIPTFVAS